MKVFEDEHISVYQNKDNRYRAYLKDEKRVVSYPRILMEQKLGRPLDPNEQVHHLNEDVTDNSDENLSIALLGEHQSMHSSRNRKYHETYAVCAWCGKIFLWSTKSQKNYFNKHQLELDPNCPILFGIKVFCSKHCSGSYGRQEQLRRNAMTECE